MREVFWILQIQTDYLVFNLLDLGRHDVKIVRKVPADIGEWRKSLIQLLDYTISSMDLYEAYINSDLYIL